MSSTLYAAPSLKDHEESSYKSTVLRNPIIFRTDNDFNNGYFLINDPTTFWKLLQVWPKGKTNDSPFGSMFLSEYRDWQYIIRKPFAFSKLIPKDTLALRNVLQARSPNRPLTYAFSRSVDITSKPYNLLPPPRAPPRRRLSHTLAGHRPCQHYQQHCRDISTLCEVRSSHYRRSAVKQSSSKSDNCALRS